MPDVLPTGVNWDQHVSPGWFSGPLYPVERPLRPCVLASPALSGQNPTFLPLLT